MKKIIFLLFVVFLSCSKKETSDKIFYYNESQGIENLDPVMASNYQSIWPLQQSLEGLMDFTQAMNLETNLAKSYSISEDALTYTFILHNNIYFHDDECFPNGKGRLIKADDFKYCFERLCDPRTKTRGSWLFRDKVKGATEYINSINSPKANDVKEITGIQSPNDTTLIITLEKPFAPFLSILTMCYAFVYPKEAVEFYKEKFGYHPVGTGPFKFSHWEFDRELAFIKNENYWLKTQLVEKKNKAGYPFVYLDGFKVTFTRSAETEFLDFQSGKLDYYSPTPEVLTQLLDENGKLKPEYNFELARQPWFNTVYLAVQLDNKMPGGKDNPLSENKKLRQAVNYAIDRKKLIQYVLKFKGIAGENGPIPIGMPGYSEDVKGYSFDKQKAIQLLAEAGYPNGKGLTLKLTVSNEETQKLIGEAVQSQLKDVGIDCQLDFMQGSTLRSSQVGGELAFWRANWGADYFDPENFMALFYSKNETPNGPNYTHYSNPKADSLYEQGMKETDFAKRKKIYNEMERIVLDDSPWIILLYNEIVYLKQKRVSDMYIDGLNTLVLKRAKVE